jgi:hypothetical protein
VINAIGFDRWSSLELVRDASVELLLRNEKLKQQVEWDISTDLSLPPSHSLPERLHVPALAGLARGPGYPNLGCLGLMAKAVLKNY